MIFIRATDEEAAVGVTDEFVDAPVELLAGLVTVLDRLAATTDLRAGVVAHRAERLLVRVRHCGEW